MRSIKFRGLRTDGKGWVYGFYIERHGMSEILQTSGTKPVIPSSVGQFTGLLDKNGKEIYEGDKVKLDISRYGSRIKNRYYAESKVTFSNTHANFSVGNYNVSIWETDRIEVIGNIHEEGGSND